MPGRFQPDERAQSDRPLMNHGLEIHGVRVGGDRGTEPGENGGEFGAAGVIPVLRNRLEALLTDRAPDAPGEYLRRTADRHVEAAAEIQAGLATRHDDT